MLSMKECLLEQDVMARDVSDVCARTCAGERGAEGGRGRGSRARAPTAQVRKRKPFLSDDVLT